MATAADPNSSQAGTPAAIFDSPFRAFNPDAIGHNARQLSFIRQVSLLAAGSAAGVLGLTNFTGFGFFLVAQLAISLSIISLAASGKPSTYLLDPASVNWDAMRVKVNASANLVKGLAAAPPGPATQVWAWAKFILLDGLVDNFLSYVLWWTFWSAIVHVYD